MSQLATLRPLSRPASARRTSPPPLRVVTGDFAKGQFGFVALCFALLLGALVGGLLLNTSMAKGSFVLGDLQHRSNELADSEDALNHAIDAQSAPAELAKRALALGMVPAQSPAFLRMSDGKVLGVAEPAKAKDGFTVVAQGTVAPAAPAPTSGKAAPKAPPAAAVGPSTTVKTSGSVTTTTVTLVKAKVIEQTITSVDKSTGRTTSTTITTPRKAPVTTKAKAKASTTKPQPKPSAAPAR